MTGLNFTDTIYSKLLHKTYIYQFFKYSLSLFMANNTRKILDLRQCQLLSYVNYINNLPVKIAICMSSTTRMNIDLYIISPLVHVIQLIHSLDKH